MSIFGKTRIKYKNFMLRRRLKRKSSKGNVGSMRNSILWSSVGSYKKYGSSGRSKRKSKVKFYKYK